MGVFPTDSAQMAPWERRHDLKTSMISMEAAGAWYGTPTKHRCVCICTYHLYIFMYIHMYIYIIHHVHVYDRYQYIVRTNQQIYTYVCNIHTYIHTYIHVYIYIYVYYWPLVDLLMIHGVHRDCFLCLRTFKVFATNGQVACFHEKTMCWLPSGKQT